MKRWLCLLLCLCLCLSTPALAADEFLVSGTPETDESDPSAQEPDYLNALALMEQGSLIDALNKFAKLGNYRDAVPYAQYLTAKIRYLRNDPAAALEGFTALDGFLDSADWAALCQTMAQHRYFDGSRFGYANLHGEITIAPAYDWAERVFREESHPQPVAAVFQGKVEATAEDLLPAEGKYGLLRADGVLIVPAAYDEILWTLDGLAAVRNGTQSFLFDLESGLPVGEAYDAVGLLAQDFIPVCKGKKWDYLRQDGTLLDGSYPWDSAQSFNEGMAGVTSEGKAGFINTSGAVAVELKYDAVTPFCEGLAGFMHKKRWGFVNQRGEEVKEPVYQEVGSFLLGRCPAKKNNHWGLIDKEGEWVLHNRYDEVTGFEPASGRAWMRNNKLWGLVALDGAILVKPAWATFTPFGTDGLSRVSYKGLYGYLDTRGVLRILSEYPAAAPFSADVGGVLTPDGSVRYLTKLGREFSVDSDFPTQPLRGFIEGRHINRIETVSIDPETEKETVSVSYDIIGFSLFDVKGNPIAVKASP